MSKSLIVFISIGLVINYLFKLTIVEAIVLGLICGIFSGMFDKAFKKEDL